MDYRKVKRWSKSYALFHKLPVPKGLRVTRNKWGAYAKMLCRTIQKFNGWTQTGVPDVKYIAKVKPFRLKLMAVVTKELGTKEWPPGSNWGPVKEYLRAAGFSFPTPWCASFVTYCLKKAGWGKGWPTLKGWVPSWDGWGTKKGYKISKYKARRGDIVIFDWERDGGGDHIGFVTRNFGPLKSVATIEGNATSDAIPGGGVVRKTRIWWQVHAVYRLPSY